MILVKNFRKKFKTEKGYIILINDVIRYNNKEATPERMAPKIFYK